MKLSGGRSRRRGCLLWIAANGSSHSATAVWAAALIDVAQATRPVCTSATRPSSARSLSQPQTARASAPPPLLLCAVNTSTPQVIPLGHSVFVQSRVFPVSTRKEAFIRAKYGSTQFVRCNQFHLCCLCNTYGHWVSHKCCQHIAQRQTRRFLLRALSVPRTQRRHQFACPRDRRWGLCPLSVPPRVLTKVPTNGFNFVAGIPNVDYITNNYSAIAFKCLDYQKLALPV
ncbi:Protein of unknown function [Gryllus bimaculatus]|nr:Protein of unknown function [Gryllus bimaculatus]